MIENIEHSLWVEKFRPQKIEDCILPADMKKIMSKYVKNGEITNHLLLSGGPGVGKTTVARAMIAEIGADCLFINASLDRNIDTLRTTIVEYASRVSMFGGTTKYVILDEADNLNPTSVQPALRAVMEEMSVNCRFILTCNYRNKLIAPLQGRCSLIEFKTPKGAEKKEMLGQTFKRFKAILQKEGVTFDDRVLLSHINRFFPNLRKALIELQSYSQINGTIDEGILGAASAENFQVLYNSLKDRAFTDMRKWVAENPDVGFEELIANMYAQASEKIEAKTLPDLVMLISKYDFQNQFVVNKEINTVSFLTEVMSSVEWKA